MLDNTRAAALFLQKVCSPGHRRNSGKGAISSLGKARDDSEREIGFDLAKVVSHSSRQFRGTHHSISDAKRRPTSQRQWR